MPGDAEIRSSALAGVLFLFLVVIVVIVFIVFFVVFLFVIRIGLGEFKHGQWQRLAKEIAFIAHPHARDFAVVDFHHAKRMAA
jgi:heme/copper-type cytochrome/quinol oxidase subunit 2